MKLVQLLVFLGISLGCTLGYAQTRVTYPAPENANDVRYNDLIEILNSALEKTVPKYGPYMAAPTPVLMNEARQLAAIEQGNTIINIVWSSTSEDKERKLLPIRIPLRKGILGYRIALTAKSKQAEIDKVMTLDDMKKLTIGQGLGWGDVEIYKSNGITVFSAQYDGLFKMAAGGRFDLFPRGISEIGPEFDANSAALPELAIEKGLLIYYPWPYYFFFNQQDKALAERIETGIRMMMRDGSFDTLFKKYNANAIEKANFKGRRVIRIENSILPKATPLSDKSLWFDPSRDLK